MANKLDRSSISVESDFSVLAYLHWQVLSGFTSRDSNKRSSLLPKFIITDQVNEFPAKTDE